MEKDENTEGVEGIVKVFSDSMTKFNNAMILRDEFAVRIGKRTTQIIRFSLIGLSVLGLAMFTLIFTLLFRMQQITEGMDNMGSYMQNMDKNFILVNENMIGMNELMSNMNKNVGVMVDMNTSISDMNGSMRQMNRYERYEQEHG